MKISENIFGKENQIYLFILSSLSIDNEVSEINSHSKKLEDQIHKNLNDTYEKNNFYYYFLSKVAQYNIYLENFQNAIRLRTNALEIIGKIYGKNHSYYVTALGDLALYNSVLGNYSEAVRLGTEALKTEEDILVHIPEHTRPGYRMIP